MDEILDINTLFGPLPSASADLAVDGLIELMQKHGVGAACTLSTLGLLLDPAIGNASTRAACGEHPELRPVATLNPMMHFGEQSIVPRLKSEGFAFVRFFPQLQGWPFDFAPFRSLAQALAQTGMPLMVDVQRPGDITQLATVLNAHDAPVILAGVDVNLLAEAVALLRERANWYVETSKMLSPGSLKLVADSAGIDRILFGTGAPVTPIASVLEALKYAGLSEDAQQAILARNAARLLSRA